MPRLGGRRRPGKGQFSPVVGPRITPPAWLDLRRPHLSPHTGPVGMNPFRQHRRSAADYVMVAAAVLACVLLVLWALFA